MYYEFYIDVYFLENLLMDYVILLLTAVVTKQSVRFLRIFAAGFLGALIACALVLLPVQNVILTFLGGYIASSVCMVKIGFGISQKRTLIKTVIFLLCITFLLGGIFQALVSQITLPVIPMGILSALVLTLFLKGYQTVKYRVENIYEITITYHEKQVCVTGLRDTGNQLTDPISKRPVSIISKDAVQTLLDDEVKVFFVPYHSIGKKHGLLKTFSADYIEIKRENEVQRVAKPLLAISEEIINQAGKYQMIVHPRMVDD